MSVTSATTSMAYRTIVTYTMPPNSDSLAISRILLFTFNCWHLHSLYCPYDCPEEHVVRSFDIIKQIFIYPHLPEVFQ